MGTGQNCTNTNLHNRKKLHRDKFAQRVNFAQEKKIEQTHQMHQIQFHFSLFAREFTFPKTLLHKSKNSRKKKLKY